MTRNKTRYALSRVAAVTLAVVAPFHSIASADRGAIYAAKDIRIEEPAQRAIIAHDGAREILILQTDVRADKETKVVEFMPLPSKPEVSLAPEDCFASLQEICRTHNIRYEFRYRGEGGGSDDTVKVVVAAELGPHNVTVVEIADADDFVTWTEGFFRENDLGEPLLGENLREIVADYLDRGFRFFAFDVVALSPDTKTVQPLTYDFECDHFYYPLVVTNLYGGLGTVELFTILSLKGPTLPDSSLDPKEQAAYFMWRAKWSTRAKIGAEELLLLHPRFADIMAGGDGGAWLQAIRHWGRLDFHSDIWVPMQPERRTRRGVPTGRAAQ